MATLQLSERVIDAAIAKLKAGMAARVTAINAEFADSYAITVPGTNDFYPFGVDLLPRAPAVVVTDGGSPEGPGFHQEGPVSFEYQVLLAVLVWEEATDRETLGRKLLRQHRAVIETLHYDDPAAQLTVTVGATTNRPYIKPFRELPGDVFQPTGDESMWRASRITVFTVSKREN